MRFKGSEEKQMSTFNAVQKLPTFSSWDYVICGVWSLTAPYMLQIGTHLYFATPEAGALRGTRPRSDVFL